MAEGDLEVVRTKRGWRIVHQGTYKTQALAEAAATFYATRLGVEMFVRAKSGRWRLRNTFPRSRDPRRSKG